MEEKKNDNKVVWVVGTVILALILIVFVPGLVEDKQNLDLLKQEEKLLKEGKVVSVSDTVEQFAELLANKDYEEADKYLLDNCEMFDTNNNKRVKLEYCLEKLSNHNSHTIEKRGNSLKDQETYRILWNGTKYEDTKQIITLYLSKKITSNEIIYKISKIIFTDNTLLH